MDLESSLIIRKQVAIFLLSLTHTFIGALKYFSNYRKFTMSCHNSKGFLQDHWRMIVSLFIISATS